MRGISEIERVMGNRNALSKMLLRLLFNAGSVFFFILFDLGLTAVN